MPEKSNKKTKGSQLPSEIPNNKPEIFLSTLFHAVTCFVKDLRDKYAHGFIYEDFHIFLFLNSFHFYLTNLDFFRPVGKCSNFKCEGGEPSVGDNSIEEMSAGEMLFGKLP